MSIIENSFNYDNLEPYDIPEKILINEDELNIRYNNFSEKSRKIIIDLIKLLHDHSHHIRNYIKDIDIPDSSDFQTILIDNADQEYYSSTLHNFSKTNLINKLILYFTPQLNQSLLHVIDKIKIMDVTKPNIFKFKLLKPIRIIKSTDLFNSKLFKGFGSLYSDNIHDIIYKYFIEKDEYKEENIEKNIEKLKKQILLGNNNIRILYIIEAINFYISHYNPQYIINGYQNEKDQNEFAIINPKEFINFNSIEKYIYTRFKYNNTEFIFTNDKINPQIKKYTDENEIYTIYSQNYDKYRMNCSRLNLQIYYRKVDDSDNFIENEDEIEYNCINTSSKDFYNKYLKYKNKYLKLKKIL
jgi:hypothetical protein